MKIEVYGEEAPAEKTLRLRLVSGRNGVKLVAVDAFGNRESQGTILIINRDGVEIAPALSPNLGLPRELSSGHVQVTHG